MVSSHFFYFFFIFQLIYIYIYIYICVYICYGNFLHGNRLFLLNIYRLYLILGEIISKQSGAYALLSGRRWAGTHFARARFIGSRICSGVSWFQRQSIEVRFDRHPRVSGCRPPGSNPHWGGVVSSPGAWPEPGGNRTHDCTLSTTPGPPPVRRRTEPKCNEKGGKTSRREPPRPHSPRRGPRHLGEGWSCMGYGPAPGPT